MKSSIILFCLLTISLLSCSPVHRLDGQYFSTHQDCIEVFKKNGRIEDYDNGIIDNLLVRQTGNKLKYRSLSSASHGLFRRIVRKYKFRFIYKTTDSLMVTPSSRLAKRHFDNRDSIVFKPQFSFADKLLNFEKIIYHAGHCGNGRCDAYDLQLDKEGNVKITVHPDKPLPERIDRSYEGRLTQDERDKLMRTLKYAQLNTLAWPPRMCCDLPINTLIIYFNGKRLYLQSMYVPIVSENLVYFLYKIASLHSRYLQASEIFKFGE
jgi:hypothetical protein